LNLKKTNYDIYVIIDDNNYEIKDIYIIISILYILIIMIVK